MNREQLEAIRARDAACAVPKAPIDDVQWARSNADRRALLAAYDALAAAARKVRCFRCSGTGKEFSVASVSAQTGKTKMKSIPCPDCADLRKLLEGGR